MLRGDQAAPSTHYSFPGTVWGLRDDQAVPSPLQVGTLTPYYCTRYTILGVAAVALYGPDTLRTGPFLRPKEAERVLYRK